MKYLIFIFHSKSIPCRYRFWWHMTHMEVGNADFASLHGQGMFRYVGPLHPYCISTIHGGHVTY